MKLLSGPKPHKSCSQPLTGSSMKSRILRFLAKSFFIIFSLFILTALSGCGANTDHLQDTDLLLYQVDKNSLLTRNSPTFIVENPDAQYNRIASPVIREENGEAEVVLDSNISTIYTESRKWSGKKGDYLNLIYRVHFTKIPHRLIPFNLSAGKNVGLLVIITLNQQQQPLLVTTVQTCGCYLAFTPTSFLDQTYWPDGWQPQHRQRVYGETLPSIIRMNRSFAQPPLTILLRDSTHRVKDIYLSEGLPEIQKQQTFLMPMYYLNHLKDKDGTTLSFFETEGSRKDYVIGSQKIWERLFISWWALDWRVGEDKRLGKDSSDGIIFYTSLKPWARSESDLRDFAGFLEYWGWNF